MKSIRCLKRAILPIFSAAIVLLTIAANVPANRPPGLFGSIVRGASPDSPRQFETELQRKDRILDSLSTKAGGGSVRIIVGFKLDGYQPDGYLSADESAEQQKTIGTVTSSMITRFEAFGASNFDVFQFIPFMGMEATAETLAEIRKSADIIFVQENVPQEPLLTESIPLIGGSPFGGSSGGTFGGFSGLGRTVAVLDSGVAKTHPFFNNRVVSEACFSKNTPTNTSYCPGGADSSTASGSGVNCDVNVIADCNHGTHVAGIAAGGNPSIIGNGVARNANIIAVQVFSRSTDCGGGTSPCNRSDVTDTIKGLERVYALRSTYNIDAVNLSLGSGQYFSNCDTEQSLYKTAIDLLRSAGIATIVASGNNGYTNALSAPACVSTAISVGSTHDGSAGFPDVVSDFSNSAMFLSLLAPGELITSAHPNGSYSNSQGTSQAAPHVAGAWAVIRQKFPTDTIDQVLTRIRYGGVLIFDPENGIGKPRLRLDTALNTSNIDPCTSISPINLGQTVNGSIIVGDCLLTPGTRSDRYSFNAAQGQQIAISQNSTAFNSFVYLSDVSGNVLVFDDNGGGGVNSRIPAGSGFFTIPAAGTYFINATSLSSGTGNYSLTLAAGAGCNFSINSSSQNIPAGGGNGSFNVTTATGCNWTAQSNAAWITTTSTGSGNGTVNYTVAANPTSSQRVGTVTAGGQTHTVTQAGVVAKTVRSPFDFDGDNMSDLSIFRPSVGEWWIRRSSNGSNFAAQFGSSTDRIVPGDFTGDQKADIAIFRPSTGSWFVLRSENSTFYSFPFGLSTDTPVPADYDGDGKTDAAVMRSSSNTWFIQKSAGGVDTIGFGSAGDKPVTADYDGDGKSDIAIYRPSNGQWWIRRSTNGSVFAAAFGLSTDRPVPGDFTGDGKADIAFFRPSTGFWFILRSEDSTFFSFPFGANGDLPAIGDFDGDGRRDAAVFRPSNSTWYVNRSTAGTLIQSFGLSTDLPIPNAFVP